MTGRIELCLVKTRSWEEGQQLWGPGGEGGFGEIAWDMLHFRCQCRAKGSVDSVGEYGRESGALEGGQSRKYRFGRYLKEVMAGAIRIDEIINEKLTQTEGQKAKDRTAD